MIRQASILLVLMAFATNFFARDKERPWLQVRSPHFVVLTDAGEKQARDISDQFERMRAVFHDAFPNIAIDAFAPITVIAVRNEKEFRPLEPAAYLAKGALKPAGYFLRGPEKNYVLLRLDTEGEHPYSVVYHEYTHMLTSPGSEWMPLWLNEGLAEFYENTEIYGKEVQLGRASADNILYLRENRLLPLPVLFHVDYESPYYHEENKGSVFYAESWALTHMIILGDATEHTHKLHTYMELLAKHTDPVEAATQAFGDLKDLQQQLERYIARSSFQYFNRKTQIDTKDLDYKVKPLPLPQADAECAELLAFNGRTADARALLQTVLQQEPNNVSARETLGYLAQREGNLTEARKWYGEAVKLDSQSYLANYYYAALTMTGTMSDAEAQEVENSLQTAVKVNPKFAPAYDRLAVFYGMRHTEFDKAHMMSVYAISYAPDVIAFRMNAANILMRMGRPSDAVKVLQAALNVAKNAQEKSAVEAMLQSVKAYVAMQHQQQQTFTTIQTSGGDSSHPPVLRRETEDDDHAPMPPVVAAQQHPFPPAGRRQVVEGAIESVQCSVPAVLDVQLTAGAKTISLHSDNYYKVAFSALNFKPEGELHPCTDLSGKKAQVTFIDADGAHQIVALEMIK